MRSIALAAAFTMLAAPAFAKSSSKKPPKEGQYCSKSDSGTTKLDAKGNTLTCKADKKGKLRWDK
jgi:hypothetical protein